MAAIIPNLIILGPQGSGKSTQAKLLVNRYGYLHVSTGELVRLRAKHHDKIAAKINSKMSKGQLINTDILFSDIITPYLKKNLSKRIIFDGIPRSLTQLSRFSSMIKNLGIDAPYMIYIDIPKSVIVRRISDRLVCSACGSIYKPGQHGYKTGICPKDHKKLLKRIDDINNTALEKRLQIFTNLTKKIFPYYKKTNHFIKIDGTASVNEVDRQIRSNIKSYEY